MSSDSEDSVKQSRTRDSNNVLGETSQTVVLRGLPIATSIEGLRTQLEEMNACVEDIKIIKDRHSGLSRGFAFVTFISTEHSRSWTESHFPAVSIDGKLVRINYSRAAAMEDDYDWMCKCGTIIFKGLDRCYKCNAGREDVISMRNPENVMYVNDGSQDVGEVPSPMLLIRGLDPLTTEETFAPLKDVRLVKDRMTQMSWGFGFLVFDNIEIANTLLYAVYNQTSPSPIVIDGRTVALAYAHANSFVPVYDSTPYNPAAQSYSGSSGALAMLAYWDQNAYATSSAPQSDGTNHGGKDGGASGVKVGANAAAGGGADAADKSKVAPKFKKGKQAEKGIAIKLAAQPEPAKVAPDSFDDELAAFYSDVGADLAPSEAPTDPVFLLPGVGGSKLPAHVAAPSPRKAAPPPASRSPVAAQAPPKQARVEITMHPDRAAMAIHPDRAAMAAPLQAEGLGAAERKRVVDIESMVADAKRKIAERMKSVALPAPTSEKKPLEDPTRQAPVAVPPVEKKKLPVSNKKFNAIEWNGMQKWEKKKSELKETAIAPPSPVAAAPIIPALDVAQPEDQDLSDLALMRRLPTDEQLNDGFSDLTLIACMLCERQFKTPADLKKHHAKSGLHKTNMQKHREKLLADLRTELTSEARHDDTDEGPQYRNRAAERRQMYNQPERPRAERFAPYPSKPPAIRS
ncbi:hypothetical protein BDK51DRAFT_25645, partial [Blyttiomyces helicus]